MIYLMLLQDYFGIENIIEWVRVEAEKLVRSFLVIHVRPDGGWDHSITVKIGWVQIEF